MVVVEEVEVVRNENVIARDEHYVRVLGLIGVFGGETDGYGARSRARWGWSLGSRVGCESGGQDGRKKNNTVVDICARNNR